MAQPDETTKIAELADEFLAQKVEAVLDERGIPHIIQSYHDTAYDGLFQTQQGWGCVLAPESQRDAVLAVIEELRSGEGG
jgi:hypothetical protein